MAAALAEGVVPQRDCSQCDERRRREYGCTEDTLRQEHWLTLEDDGDVVKRCPRAIVGLRELRVMQYAALIESGVLPDAGGWLDQAASLTEAIAVMLSARRRFSEDKRNDRR